MVSAVPDLCAFLALRGRLVDHRDDADHGGADHERAAHSGQRPRAQPHGFAVLEAARSLDREEQDPKRDDDA
jgi:hypothetical protein